MDINNTTLNHAYTKHSLPHITRKNPEKYREINNLETTLNYDEIMDKHLITFQGSP